jgi:hypothetical protein
MKARSSFFTYKMLIPSNDKVTRKLLVWIKIGVKECHANCNATAGVLLRHPLTEWRSETEGCFTHKAEGP